jgi:hypothetical protein
MMLGGGALPSPDSDALVGVVRTATGQDVDRIEDVRVVRLHGGTGTSAGVYRVSGAAWPSRRRGGPGRPPISVPGGGEGAAGLPAADRRGRLRWSLILKVLRPPDGSGRPAHALRPSHHQYWKREALAYASGLLSDLPGGIAAPRCPAVAEQADGSVWVWLEDLGDVAGEQWPMSQYGLVARRLGRFNGAYLCQRPLPDAPWLSRRWARGWSGPWADAVAALPSAREHPHVRRLCPDDVADGIARVWAEREAFLDPLEGLPPSFCHLDAFRRNLIARPVTPGAHGGEATVAIDWEYCGIAAVGEDLAPLVGATLLFLEVDPAEAATLDQVAFDGYVQGLRDAGWTGAERVVRFGYAAATGTRYGIAASTVPWLLQLQEFRSERLAQVMGRPIDEIIDRWPAAVRFVLQLADEARALRRTL